MAKILYAGSASDFVVSETTVLASPSGTVDILKLNPGASLEAWSAGTSGSQVTDLALFTGDYAVPGGAAPAGLFPAQASSTFLFWAEDTLDEIYVVGAGLGVTAAQRWYARPINDIARLRALEALDPISSSEKGDPLGVAPLDASGLVDPSYLPASGVSGVIDITSPVGGTESGHVVLSTADLGAMPTSWTISPGTAMTGGGSGAANRTLSVALGTSAGTAAEGNHTHGGFTTSPRPVFVQVLSTDSPAAWKTAAAADATHTLVCDGTNDEVQIQAGIDLAAPLQSRNAGMPAGAEQIGRVQLSGGRFNIGAAGIKMRTAVSLMGNGKGTEVRAVSCNQPGMISLASANDHLCEVRDMYLQGNSGSGGTCSAINFDMTASGNTSTYPDTNPDSDHLIENLFIDEFRGTNRHGVYLHSTGTANNRGNIVKDLQIRDCTGGCGVYFDGASDSYIETCHVGGSGDTGYRIAGGNTKMIGNKSFYSNANGVWVTSGRVNITGHESQDDSTGYFFDGVPGTAVGLVCDTSDVAGIRVSNDRLQIIGFNVFVRSNGRYGPTGGSGVNQQKGLWFDSGTAFTNCAIIGNVENQDITTPVSGPAATGTYLVTIS
jgi:hypothetical protein